MDAEVAKYRFQESKAKRYLSAFHQFVGTPIENMFAEGVNRAVSHPDAGNYPCVDCGVRLARQELSGFGAVVCAQCGMTRLLAYLRKYKDDDESRQALRAGERKR